MRQILTKRIGSFAAFVLVVLALSACSQDASPSSGLPTTPSATGPTPTPPVSSSGGATITGTIVGGSSTASVRPSSLRALSTGGLTISVVGSSATAPVDGSGNFTLAGVPAGDIQLQITGHGTNAQVTITGVGAQDTIQIHVTVSGGSATLDTTQQVTPDSHVQLEGVVTAIGANTLTVLGWTVSVDPTTTHIGDGISKNLSFADIEVNDRVHVSGTKTGATTLNATNVIVQTPKPDQHPVAVNGPVAALLSGGCSPTPTLAFTVGTTTIKTGIATKFVPGSCSDIVVGVTVHVQGVQQTDGSVKANNVEIQSHGHP